MEEQLQNVPSIPQAQKRERRTGGGESDDEDDFEVQNVLSKFKCMENRKDDEFDKKPKPKRQMTPPPEGGVGIDPEALKARFEQGTEEKDPKEEEERRKRLEEEFKLYKDEKERLKQLAAEEDEGDDDEIVEKEDMAINPEHAAKMKQRWEKIQKKEAKKAQKDKARRPLPGYSLPTPTPEFCFECEKKVYLTEKIECNRRVIHRSCFRCKHCMTNLRMETCAMGPDGIYCNRHYKELFNNMSKILYDPRRARECAPA